jgi:hypothetical protein
MMRMAEVAVAQQAILSPPLMCLLLLLKLLQL